MSVAYDIALFVFPFLLRALRTDTFDLYELPDFCFDIADEDALLDATEAEGFNMVRIELLLLLFETDDAALLDILEEDAEGAVEGAADICERDGLDDIYDEPPPPTREDACVAALGLLLIIEGTANEEPLTIDDSAIEEATDLLPVISLAFANEEASLLT